MLVEFRPTAVTPLHEPGRLLGYTMVMGLSAFARLMATASRNGFTADEPVTYTGFTMLASSQGAAAAKLGVRKSPPKTAAAGAQKWSARALERFEIIDPPVLRKVWLSRTGRTLER